MIDHLLRLIEKKESPVCAGLDTRFEYVPPEMLRGTPSDSPLRYAADNIYAYNCALMDAFVDIVPCVKLQSACYELYGPDGMAAMRDTILYAKSLGLVVIVDGKRGDIGSTAAMYADAYIGRTQIGDQLVRAYDADFITVNAYLGSDGVQPFIDDCAKYDASIFVLVKTSNPSSGEIQDLVVRDGHTVYEEMMKRVQKWGSGLMGEFGYSDVCAVVGATYPSEAAALRRAYPSVFFLLPGAGTQGADLSELRGCFDDNGRGAIVNNSRAMLTAWRNVDTTRVSAPEAARKVLEDMRLALLEVVDTAR